MDDTTTPHKIFVVILGIIIIAGFLYLGSRDKTSVNDGQTVEETQQVVDNTTVVTPNIQTGGSTFVSNEGGYSFVVPQTWMASTNKFNAKNTLVGPMVSSNSGVGGIEVIENTAAETFLSSSYAEAEYDSKKNVTVGGLEGTGLVYSSSLGKGHSVVVERGGNVYNIYINSDQKLDLENFDKLVASFKFSN